jgi:hypothetical protein
MTDTAHAAHGHFVAVPAGGVSPYPGYVLPETDRFSRFMLRLWARSPRWSAPLLVLVCFAGGVTYALALNPTASGAFDSPTCLIKMTTGFDCPGCGGTRAFWYLLHGDIPAAARSHLMAVFAAPFLVYMYIAWAVNQTTRFKLPHLRLSPKVISMFLVAWIVFTVARNLPWAPFTWLYV